MIDILNIQGEIYIALSKLNYDVYDYVPSDATYPFISIGYNQILDDSNKTNEGFEMLQYIDIYSNYKGQKEVKEISQVVLQSIKKLNIKGLYVDVKLRGLEVLKEGHKSQAIDGTTKDSLYHGVLIIKLKLKQL